MPQRSHPRERILPCLLDRLTDQYPRARKESREHRALSLRHYRESVLQELLWLLNTESHPHAEDLAEFEQMRRSVINYGIRSLGGLWVSNDSAGDIEEQIRAAILAFEPRILPESLSVEVMVSGEGRDLVEHNAITLEIRGELWAEPVPEQLYLRTEVDLETGQCAMKTM